MNIVRLSLTYNNEDLKDGLGAQVMRKVAIKSISKHYNLGYVDSKITEIIVTQLDIAQNPIEIKTYLDYVNPIFEFQNVGETKFQEIHNVYNLSRRILAKFVLKSLFLRRPILLRIVVPFYITNFNPEIFQSAKEFLPHLNQEIDLKRNSFKRIVIHFRAGANLRHIDTGKSEARSLPLSYFEDLTLSILKKNPGTNFEIVLLTDAPPQAMTYFPPTSQLEMWERTGYEIKNGSIKIEPLQLEGSKFLEFSHFHVKHGGDVIEALKEMESADYFLMSRSTLSFLGALLNRKGRILYPPRIGTEPLKHWVSAEQYLKNI